MVQLADETEDALGEDVDFTNEGTPIWETECMLSKVKNLSKVVRFQERIMGIRKHNCGKLKCPDGGGEKENYDYCVKWDDMQPQCSTWESDFIVEPVGSNLFLKGTLDAHVGKGVTYNPKHEQVI
jgi:hypothetical protein